MRDSQKGQTTLEYLLLITVLALLSTLIYRAVTPRTAGVVGKMRGAFQNSVRTGETSGKSSVSYQVE